MGRTPKDVTDTELAVLQLLWQRGALSRRQIADALYPGSGASQYTTVQKLLERLRKKGHVRQRRGPDGLIFAARTDCRELINRRLQEVADKLCDGSLTPLLLNLAQAATLSEEELEVLRRLIEAHPNSPKTPD
jgi:predicted transcriptional regulator